MSGLNHIEASGSVVVARRDIDGKKVVVVVVQVTDDFKDTALRLARAKRFVREHRNIVHSVELSIPPGMDNERTKAAMRRLASASMTGDL